MQKMDFFFISKDKGMQTSYCGPNYYRPLQLVWSFKGADSEWTHSGITSSTQTFSSTPSYSWQALEAARPWSFPDIHMICYSWKTKLFSNSSLKRQKVLDMPELSSSLISIQTMRLGWLNPKPWNAPKPVLSFMSTENINFHRGHFSLSFLGFLVLCLK